MEENIKIKAKFKGTSRRFEIRSTTTWNDLLEQLQRLFEIQGFLVKYCDDVNELVSLSSQDELNEALRVCKQASKLLYLYIEDPTSQQTTDTSLLEFEEKNPVQKKEKHPKKKSSNSCYSDLASDMASELAALNARIEKSTKKQSEKQTQEPSKQKVEDQPKVKKDRKTESSSTSCYAEMAHAVAPELAALNARLSKISLNDKKSKKPADEPQSEIVGKTTDAPKSCYINLEDVMAQSRQQETDEISSTKREEPQTSSANIGASRGWFNEFEQYQGPQENASATQGKTKKKQKKKPKKQGCYDELAEAIAPELARLTVKENVPVQGEGSYSASEHAENKDKSSDSASEHAENKDKSSDSASEHAENKDNGIQKEDALNEPPVKFDTESKRQLDQSNNQNVKKPKRSRKSRDKKKGCYAMMAEDIAPLFGAMNKRLEEQQKQQKLDASFQLVAPPEQLVPSAPEHEVPLYTSSPESSSNEPFVFVSHGDDQMSEENGADESIEQENVSKSYFDDSGPLRSLQQPNEQDQEDGTGKSVEPEIMPKNPSYFDDLGPQSYLEQPNEQKQDLSSEPNLISFGEERDLTQPQEEEKLRLIMKKYLDESMDSIVNEAIHRLHVPNPKTTPSAPCNTPQGQATPSVVITVHKGITCDYCGKEIHGIRYKCGNCKDFDLCETCEEIPGIHNLEHVFIKLRFAAPGIGRRHGEMVPIFKKSVYKKEKRQKEKELRRAAKEAERERKRAIKKNKHALKAQEKERKRREKAKKTHEREEPKSVETSQVYDRLQASFVSDDSFPNGTIVSPGQKFLKNWMVQNEGSIAWNQWITLECIEGSIIGFPSAVPHLKPSSSDVVTVEFVAPEVPGTYFSKWKLSYGLHSFGPHLLCEIQVLHGKEQESSIQHDQHSLVDTAFKMVPLPETEFKLEYEAKLQASNTDDGSSSEYLSSEDTPDFDPGMSYSSFDRKNENSISSFSLIGQQRQDLEWDTGCAHDLEIVNVNPDDETTRRERRLTDTDWSMVDTEESDGEESDSSLDEFTVLIPTCFDPDAPLTADPIPMKVKGDYKKQYYSSPFLNSIESDSEIKHKESGPSSLPNMDYMPNEERPLLSLDTHQLSHQSDSAPVTDSEPEEPNQAVITPSGSISPCDPPPQEAVCNEKPVSKQPSMSSRGSIPLVTQPTTVKETRHYRSVTSGDESDSNNIVSEVLSSAIDAVANAGRAAIATVDNLINGGIQATATYKPEEECEVSVAHTTQSNFDAPPPPPLVWPMNREATNNMDRLIEMGFGDRKLNERLLLKHKNDLRATIDELLGHIGNDWPSQRH